MLSAQRRNKHVRCPVLIFWVEAVLEKERKGDGQMACLACIEFL